MSERRGVGGLLVTLLIFGGINLCSYLFNWGFWFF